MVASDLVAGCECGEGTLTFREQHSPVPTQGSIHDRWMVPFENADPIRPMTTYKGQPLRVYRIGRHAASKSAGYSGFWFYTSEPEVPFTGLTRRNPTCQGGGSYDQI